MHKLIATSGAARPTGSPPQRKIFRISSGVFKGRLAALYMDSVSGISMVWSDYPHQAWSDPLALAADSMDSPFGAFMDEAGHIHLVYTHSSKSVKFKKLTFAGGGWSVGSAIDVISLDDNYNPFILKDNDGTVWCFFVNHAISSDSEYYVRAKYSADGGLTWGSGATDLGALLSAGTADICFVTGCQIASFIYAVYTSGRSDLKLRAFHLFDSTWGSELSIHSGGYIDDDFDCAPSSDGKLGLAFAVSGDSKIYFKEFDGSGWSGLREVETRLSRSPQIAYLNNTPHIFHAGSIGNGYYCPRHAVLTGDSFEVSDYASEIGVFDKVFVYNDSAVSKFQDKTSEAEDDTVADIIHSESSALLDSIGDCLYLGGKERFFSISAVLSTPGIGGAVAWEYFNGADWISFTPESGIYDFDSADSRIILWQDGLSVPSGWRLGAVNNFTAFWVRARVTAGFSENPVGSQITGVPKCDDLSLVREGL